jgi:hypothetical protein
LADVQRITFIKGIAFRLRDDLATLVRDSPSPQRAIPPAARDTFDMIWIALAERGTVELFFWGRSPLELRTFKYHPGGLEVII